MIAVVPVRGGRPSRHADAAVAECAGRVLLVGESPRAAARALRTATTEVLACEAGAFDAGRWSEGLAPLLVDEPAVVLPGAPDGRDLLGRLAATLGRPAFAWCASASRSSVVTTRHEGVASLTVPLDGPFVATLVPPVGWTAEGAGAHAEVRDVPLGPTDDRHALVVEGVDDADPLEVDLAEATRVLAGGVGLGDAASFDVLGRVAVALHASLGATRPVADRGIVGHERQIGTTGVAIDPVLYVAFGVSGAVQHTAGLGRPARVIAVNTDPACPMMALADLAVVADAPGTVLALARRLGVAP